LLTNITVGGLNLDDGTYSSPHKSGDLNSTFTSEVFSPPRDDYAHLSGVESLRRHFGDICPLASEFFQRSRAVGCRHGISSSLFEPLQRVPWDLNPRSLGRVSARVFSLISSVSGSGIDGSVPKVAGSGTMDFGAETKNKVDGAGCEPPRRALSVVCVLSGSSYSSHSKLPKRAPFARPPHRRTIVNESNYSSTLTWEGYCSCGHGCRSWIRTASWEGGSRLERL